MKLMENWCKLKSMTGLRVEMSLNPYILKKNYSQNMTLILIKVKQSLYTPWRRLGGEEV
jgi:hypothetical protein